MSVKQYQSGDELFKAACVLADTPATRRQYAKWNQKRGKAYSKKNEAQQELNKK